MAESTLSLTFEDLGRSTAFYLGYSRKATEAEGLTVAQAANVEAANRAGYRKFLKEWNWAFLTPRLNMTLWATVTGTVTATHLAGTSTVTATTAKFFSSMIGHSIVIATIGTFTITGYTSSIEISVSGDATCTAKTFTIAADGVYRLPDDFGGFDSEEFHFEPNNGDPRKILLTSEPLVVESWQFSTQTQRPTMAGVRPLLMATGGQRFDLVVSPIPDQNYTASARYAVLADALTAGKYPYGGEDHAESIRLACLGAAEEMFNETQFAMRNAMVKEFDRSKANDRRNNRSERLGVSHGRQYGSRGFEPTSRCVGATAYGIAY